MPQRDPRPRLLPVSPSPPAAVRPRRWATAGACAGLLLAAAAACPETLFTLWYAERLGGGPRVGHKIVNANAVNSWNSQASCVIKMERSVC